VRNLLKAIVGVELQIESIEGKWKTSQNRSAADREGVIRGLREIGTDAAHSMAAAVAVTLEQ
jgi:transcriptional regulator